MATAPAPGSRETRAGAPAWRSFDPLVVLVGVVSLVVFLLHRWDSVLSRDLALYSYAGQQVADGVPPYVGVLNRAGPLAHALPAVGVLGARLLGTDELLGMRVFYMLVTVAAVCVAYLWGRDVLGSRSAGLVTAATLLGFEAVVFYATGGPREKTPMLLFILLALWAASHRRWFVAGVLVSLATLTLQIAFFFAFPAVLLTLLVLCQGKRLRAAVEVVIGGLVPLLLCLGYFLVVGELRSFANGFLLLNAGYNDPDPPLTRLGTVWASMQDGYGRSLWFLLLGLAAVAGFSAASRSARLRARHPWLLLVAALGGATLVDLLWNLRDFDSWADAFPILPVAALGIAAGVRVLQERLSPRWSAVAAGSWLTIALTTALLYAVGSPGNTLVGQRRSVDTVLSVLPADATVLSVEAPQPLVLSGRTNPTRYQMFTGGMERYLDDTWPGGLDGFRTDMLEQERPAVVAVNPDRLDEGWAAALEAEYADIGSAYGWRWFARRALGRDVLTELRTAASSG